MRELESFDSPSRLSRRVDCIDCKSALSKSDLPGLDHALNPYVGCEHDCIYCYAPYVRRVERASWSAVKAKSGLPKLLAKELERPRGMIGIGTVTDPYQPIEKETELTRRCLELIVAKQARFSILTKSDLVVRDIDLIRLSSRSEVGLTITTLDDVLAKAVEPHAPSPGRRLDAVRRLVSAGIEAYVFVGPVLPRVTDADLDSFIGAIADTGAKRIMTDRLRLRPGMLDRLAKAVDPWIASGPGFAELARSPGHLEKLVRDVEAAAAEHGLRVESAF